MSRSRPSATTSVVEKNVFKGYNMFFHGVNAPTGSCCTRHTMMIDRMLQCEGVPCICCLLIILYFNYLLFPSDEDMQSLASLMSVKPTDIGNLDDFNESDEEEDKKSVTATGRQIFSGNSSLVFPLLFLSPPLLCSFLAAAVVPHTLTRPNRPAPPPPDQRNSIGPTFPASGIFIFFCSCCLFAVAGGKEG